jgi:hypothetical protein
MGNHNVLGVLDRWPVPYEARKEKETGMIKTDRK